MRKRGELRLLDGTIYHGPMTVDACGVHLERGETQLQVQREYPDTLTPLENDALVPWHRVFGIDWR